MKTLKPGDLVRFVAAIGGRAKPIVEPGSIGLVTGIRKPHRCSETDKDIWDPCPFTTLVNGEVVQVGLWMVEKVQQ